MKRTTKIFAISVLCLTPALVLGACQEGENAEASELKGTYIIIDAGSKSVLSTIKTDNQDRMTGSVVYNRGVAGQARDYYYDQNDRIVRMDETTPQKGLRSVLFASEEALDANGNLRELVITSSAGDSFKNTFTYDEAGKLLSSRVLVNGKTTLRKEYEIDESEQTSAEEQNAE
ncbi:MAG: hypothetical protein LBG72_07045 [Spirochaetaceae bacterium]|nr:hypothetical protein [Spirochaetaceae bacterium]